jgi:hypothetical protein
LKLPSAVLRREQLQYKVTTITIATLNIILLTAAELPIAKRENKIKCSDLSNLFLNRSNQDQII